jgi:hypothetical protein
LSTASVPVHARQTIQGNAWIPLLPGRLPSSTPSCPPATFSDFLETLDEWETELFLELTMLVDCHEFIRLVDIQRRRNTQIQLLTMSDGSDNNGAMTFGWTISLPDGTCLARCSGPAYGPFGMSFPAEGYGFLSVS